MATLSKEDKELFNFIINDPQSTEEEKKSAREVLEKFGGEKTTSTKKASPKKTTAKKTTPKKATTKSSMSDLEKKKAELKKKTGKTLEECEKIIEQYKALKSSDATQKKKATSQKVQAKKRTTKLKKEGKVIKGTTEKNSEATLNTATKKVVKKIDKEVDKIEKTSKTEKQVEQKISSLVTKAVRSNKKLFTDTAKELAKVDKTNAKQYLMSLKKEIDTLLKKYEYGGMLPSNFGQAGLVGETGTMNEVDLFAMGGTLPQGVHQYYANTYNPAYPTPHGYAKGGEIDTISELYEVEKYDQYPYARDLVAHFIYGDDERGNLIVDATNGRYTKQLADYSELSDLMMQYENTWKDEGNMEYIDRQVRDYFSEIDIIDYYAKGGEVDDINKFKKQLIAKAKRKGLYENFGQAEVRKLEDKYGYSNKVREFDNWAMNFDLSQMAKGGMTGNKNSQIISEIEEIQSEITERPPKVYEREGQIKLSSEEGDEFSDYYGEFYTPLYVDARLEAIADKYNSYWEWQNAGTLVLVQEFAKGGGIRDYEPMSNEVYNELDKIKDWKIIKQKKYPSNNYDAVWTHSVAKDKDLYFGSGDFYRNALIIDGKVSYPIYFTKKDKAEKDFNSESFAKGGMTQGYNDKLDESLGNTKGKRSAKKQNYKDRRNESESMEKKGGKRKYARVKTMDKGTRKKRKTPMTLAKAIRRDGEKWQDAVKRATVMMKKEK